MSKLAEYMHRAGVCPAELYEVYLLVFISMGEYGWWKWVVEMDEERHVYIRVIEP